MRFTNANAIMDVLGILKILLEIKIGEVSYVYSLIVHATTLRL